MARISGVDLPNEKRVEIGLTYIYGVGRVTANKILAETGINPDFYNIRVRDYEEILPWDFVDVGVSKKFLISESEKAKRGETTQNCREGCSGCGVISAFGGGLCG